jgi:alpha-glucosidase
MLQRLRHAWFGIRTLGLLKAIQVAVYPVRRAFHEARFRGRAAGSYWSGWAGLLQPAGAAQDLPPTDPSAYSFFGTMRSYHQEGASLTFLYDGGTLRVTVLAPHIWQLAAASDGYPSSARPSYSIAPQQTWPECPYTVTELPDSITLSTARVTCVLCRDACRVSFLDSLGRVLHQDAEGIALGRGRVAHFVALPPDTHLFGLGEKATPLDRRGQRLVLWNQDPQIYSPGEDPLYLSIPFLMTLRDGIACGLFYDNTYRAAVDLGHQSAHRLTYASNGGPLRYYFIYGPEPDKVMEYYTQLTGHMAMPPLWALGYHQSRWSYYPEERVREIAHLFRQHHIPCDTIHLDIHYMDGYRCFTWDRSRFPDPQGLLSDLHRDGFHTVVLIDCGIKAAPGYAVCAEGLAKGYFGRYPDGKVAGGPVWPGESYFPDFSHPEVRDWWGGLHRSLLEAGVDGIWNDMNEPTVQAPAPDTLAGCVRHDADGRGATHREMHNLYGMLMARATMEGLQRLRPSERPFVITRSGWAGVQRYATSWTGDNQSTWEHLRITVPMVLGLGLSGLAFTGPDIGGFGGDADGELLVRWTQLAAFLPLFRNHSALNTRSQEPWAFGEPFLSHCRSAIELRYRLLPYVYTAVWQSSGTGMPIARPLFFLTPDDADAIAAQDEFMMGDSILVAPVGEPGAITREVYLPEGNWVDYWSDREWVGPADLTVDAPLDRIPVFVRAGSVIPMWPSVQHTSDGAPGNLILHAYPGRARSWLYQDDGHSRECEAGINRIVHIDADFSAAGSGTITTEGRGPFVPAASCWQWHIHGLSRQPDGVRVNGLNHPCNFDDGCHMLTLDTGPEPKIELHLAAGPMGAVSRHRERPRELTAPPVS